MSRAVAFVTVSWLPDGDELGDFDILQRGDGDGEDI